jgi:hypothetical protein
LFITGFAGVLLAELAFGIAHAAAGADQLAQRACAAVAELAGQLGDTVGHLVVAHLIFAHGGEFLSGQFGCQGGLFLG